MKPESGRTISAWMDGVEVPCFEPLESDASCDVCVVGAGISGLTTAYLLAKAGKRVIVIDDGPICGGETQRTTAHLSNVIDDTYSSIKSEYGLEKAQLAFESHNAAIDLIEKIVGDEKIDCDFMRLDGYLFRGLQKSHNRLLRKEFDTCKEIGIEGIEMMDSVPLKFTPEPRMCIRFPRQAQFHVLKYLRSLAIAIVGDGGQIFSGTHMTEVEDGKPARVKTEDAKTITAQHVVIATNSPVTDWLRLHSKQAAYRTYVVAGKVPIGSVPRGLYWDTEDPYHYIRCHKVDGDGANELLIVGGEDHRTGEEKDTDRCFANLEDWARTMFPMLTAIEYYWSGQVEETVDGLAFIGKDPSHGENIFVATGDSGMGMTHGTIAGMVLTDLIRGIANPWTELYNPSRIPVKAALNYVYENVNTAMQYAHYAQFADAEHLDEIERGEGALMRHKGKLYAVYCDESGVISQCSAVCPHASAIVQWNHSEGTWDCPAHGSRFKGTGEVINGPANQALTKIADDQLIRDGEQEDLSWPLRPGGDSGIQPPPNVM